MQKSISKSFICMILSLSLLMSLGTTQANASTYTKTNGFNTFSKAWAYHSTKAHYASVTNDNGSFAGSNKSKGKWSKIEAPHKGTSIKYAINY